MADWPLTISNTPTTSARPYNRMCGGDVGASSPVALIVLIISMAESTNVSRFVISSITGTPDIMVAKPAGSTDASVV